MEFKQVIGLRRSIRIWEPWHPVEQEKLQAILEAIYQAPRVMEVDFLRVVVLHRDQLSPQDLEAMKGPTTTAQVELCPTYIWIYADLDALEAATDGHNLEEMVEAGALNLSHGWDSEHIHSTIVPNVYRELLDDDDQLPIVFRTPDGTREGPSYSRGLTALGRWAIGFAQEYALLAAVDEGLGAQLSAINPAVPKRVMGIPDSWINGSPVLLGYAAESLDTGGQRVREPLEEDFFEGSYDRPFVRDAAVVEKLKEAGMVQPPAPLPWRRTELRRLARMFGLPE
ncbi:MAG TPA: nitroreductase family protein [Dehalococcoidia bacterium]|jgi:nitroreductase|nr:nitroreductase family protein [Dehalococcoidia bacterium]